MFKRKNVTLNRPVPDRGAAAAADRASADRSVPDRTRPVPATRPHPGIRHSLVNAKPCVSTSSRSLDRALAHGGVPLGSVTMIEEHGTTDFASAILRALCTLSVCESREGHASRVLCVGIAEWMRAVPSVSKKAARSSSSSSSSNKMKIAWRYAKYATDPVVEPASAYCRDVDFKSALVPAPQVQEAGYILGRSLSELAASIEAEVRRTPKSTLLRIVVPSFLHPALYPPAQSSVPQELYAFMGRLRRAVVAHGNAVAFVTMPLQLYPRTQSLVAGLELLCDNCIELEPFDSGDDNVQGFLHINRIAHLSDRGEMVEQRQELSFKLGRYQFVVEPYAIPVEVQEEKDTEGW